VRGRVIAGRGKKKGSGAAVVETAASEERKRLEGMQSIRKGDGGRGNRGKKQRKEAPHCKQDYPAGAISSEVAKGECEKAD